MRPIWYADHYAMHTVQGPRPKRLMPSNPMSWYISPKRFSRPSQQGVSRSVMLAPSESHRLRAGAACHILAILCAVVSGCAPGSTQLNTDAPPVASTQDVVRSFTTAAYEATSPLAPSDFYAALEVSSSGIVTAASQCRPELLARLASFAKHLFSIERDLTFIVTADVTVNGNKAHDDLPLLVIRNADLQGGGRSCEVTGPALTATASRISPYFRVDPDSELQLSFDVKVIQDAKIGTVAAILDHSQQVMSLAGGQTAVVGKLGADLASGLAQSLDSAIAASLRGTSNDQITAALRPTVALGGAPVDGVRFDLTRYLAGGPAQTAVAGDAVITVALGYRRSVVGQDRADGTVQFPASADTILSFRRAVDGPGGSSFGKALDEGLLSDFNPKYLRTLARDEDGRRAMQDSCRALRVYLKDDLQLTDNDALFVRYAALLSKTSYYQRPDLWNIECLSGAYLEQIGAGSGGQDEGATIQRLSPSAMLPNISAQSCWTCQIADRIRDLRLIAMAPGPSGIEDHFRLSVEDFHLVPYTFFGKEPPAIPWAAYGPEAASRLRELAYGGLCGRVTEVYASERAIKDLALFGRPVGASADGFTGWRDGRGNPIVPLVATWSEDLPPKLVEMRIAPVETIRQDYARTISSWPEEDVASCTDIHR